MIGVVAQYKAGHTLAEWEKQGLEALDRQPKMKL
jgi:hypothetical protein